MNDKNGVEIKVGCTVISFGNKYVVSDVSGDVYGQNSKGHEYLMDFAENLEVVSEGC